MSAKCNVNLLNNNVNIDVSGELNIQNIGEIYNSFKSALDFNTNVQIHHSDVSALDLSYLQMLVSFVNHLSEKSLTADINLELDEKINQLIELSGLKKYIIKEM